MRKLLIIPALMLITGCASVSKVEVNPNVSFNENQFKKAEKGINKKQFEADVSGKTGFKKSIVDFTSGFLGGFVGASGGFATSQAVGYTVSELASKNYMRTVPRNSWVIECLFKREVKTFNPNFELILVYPNRILKKKLNDDSFVLFRGKEIGFRELFGGRFSEKYGVKLVKKSSNKIIVLIVDGGRYLMGTWFTEKYPWLKGLAEVYIDNKLAGRYLLYGVAWRPDGGILFNATQGAIPELYKRISQDFLKNSTVASK